MSVNLKSIVVSYNVHDETFHRESLLEYTQGNALRILKNLPVHYHAIAVVETNEEAERAMEAFSGHQRVARGLEEPMLVKPRVMPAAAVYARRRLSGRKSCRIDLKVARVLGWRGRR